MEHVEENPLMIKALNPNKEILDPSDIVSRNPIHLLQHILSFMPDKDAAKTSILSRKWRRVRRQSLLKLSLKNYSLNDKEFQKMFETDFYSVAKLYLKECYGLKNLILSSYKLRKLKLIHCIGLEKLELVVQNLEMLSIHASSPCEIIFPVLRNLKSICLVGVHLTNEMFEDNISKFPFLETLELVSCHMLENIRISSHNLKDLFLTNCSQLQEVKVDTPNLKSFLTSRCNFASFQSSNSLDMVHVLVELEDPNVPADLYLQKLTGFLSNFNHCQLLTWLCKSDQNIFINKEVRESLTPPLYGLKHLLVKIDSSPVKMVALVDNILWTCPRLEILQLWLPSSSNMLLFQYEDLEGGNDDYPCCSNYPLKCWRHTLKNVILKMHRRIEARYLMNYFSRNLRGVRRNINFQNI